MFNDYNITVLCKLKYKTALYVVELTISFLSLI